MTATITTAYHGDPQLKADMLSELAWHREQDKLIRGTYGDGKSLDFRGCAIACSIHSLNRKRGTMIETGDHQGLADATGWPIRLVYLEDRIFENLPDPLHLAWPERFASAIKPSADLAMVSARFLHWLLVDPEDGVIQYTQKAKTKTAIQAVGDLYLGIVNGGTVSDDEWRNADAAADASAAASAAAYAASAYADAYAAAASAAASAAAYAAAYAADADAAAYARSKKWVRISDKLIELLEAA